MELTHHAAVFRLLGREPRASVEAERALLAREVHCGVPFPAAVREWYSLESAEELTGDALVPLAELGDPPDVARGWLYLGGDGVYAKLDGADDPRRTPRCWRGSGRRSPRGRGPTSPTRRCTAS